MIKMHSGLNKTKIGWDNMAKHDPVLKARAACVIDNELQPLISLCSKLRVNSFTVASRIPGRPKIIISILIYSELRKVEKLLLIIQMNSQIQLASLELEFKFFWEKEN